jgi:hypothetical protein
VLEELLARERAALADWGRGEPDGYLAISADDVTYFDPFVERRLDGRAALADWYRPLRGTIRVDRDEILSPRVQLVGAGAVLTFQLVSEGSGGTLRWNCTEVYERRGDGPADGWAIVHTHWSFTGAGA